MAEVSPTVSDYQAPVDLNPVTSHELLTVRQVWWIGAAGIALTVVSGLALLVLGPSGRIWIGSFYVTIGSVNLMACMAFGCALAVMAAFELIRHQVRQRSR